MLRLIRYLAQKPLIVSNPKRLSIRIQGVPSEDAKRLMNEISLLFGERTIVGFTSKTVRGKFTVAYQFLDAPTFRKFCAAAGKIVPTEKK